MEPKTYQLFLSYSRKDTAFVEQLAEDCRQNGISVWFDKWELAAGSIFPNRIQEGINKSKFFGIVLSPDSNKSKWVDEELNQAYMKALDDNRECIIPIRLSKDAAIPGLLRSRKPVDFFEWSENEAQYKASLDFLIRSVIKRQPLKKDDDGTIGSSASYTLSGALIRDLNARPMQEQGRLLGYSGTSNKKIVYVDCDDRVWVSVKRILKSINGRETSLKIPTGNALRVLGDDQHGRFWAIIGSKLHFLVQRSTWTELTIPKRILPLSVTIWHDPPNGVAGPIGLCSNGAAIISSTDWKWRYASTSDFEMTCATASGSSVWVAGPQGCAVSTYPELKWTRIYRFRFSLVRPIAVLVSKTEPGLWIYSGDHMLWWIDLAVRKPKPKRVTTADGLPGNRVDLAAIDNNGRLWCATSGGVAKLEHSKNSHFVTVSHDQPDRLWVDQSDRTWYLAGQKVWCWFSKE